MAADLPTSMKAAQWSSTSGGIDKNMKVESVPLPKKAGSLPKDSTLVKVAYTTLNPVDYKIPEFAGRFGPKITCVDFAGTVVSSTLPHLKPGEPVFGKTDPPVCGALAEYVISADPRATVPVPDGVSLKEASTLGVCGLTAYQSIGPYVKEGDKIFINGGSGGTGTFGIQIAKALGCSVTTTCSGPNVDLCKSLGADEVIDYRTTNVIDHLKRQGTQYDLIVDNIGQPDIYWNAHHYLKPSGLYATIAGNLTISYIMSLMMVLLLPTFLGGGQRKSKFVTVVSNAAEYAQLASWMKEGKVKPVIDKELPLEEAGQGFTMLKTGRQRGKIIIKVAGE